MGYVFLFTMLIENAIISLGVTLWRESVVDGLASFSLGYKLGRDRSSKDTKNEQE